MEKAFFLLGVEANVLGHVSPSSVKPCNSSPQFFLSQVMTLEINGF